MLLDSKAVKQKLWNFDSSVKRVTELRRNLRE
jgi:hypothetical protein